MSTQNLSVSVENLAPQNGTILSPVWFGFHNGGFDAFNAGEAATFGLEVIAEDGGIGPISQEFANSGAGNIDGRAGNGLIFPSALVQAQATVDSAEGRFFTYASMLLPSNDTFIGNDNAIEVFDAQGKFIGTEFVVTRAYDAGTEVSDEIPENTADFGQTVPNTGVDENGVVRISPGFNPVGSGGILDAPEFANADFTAPGYEIARVRVANLVEGSGSVFGTAAQDDIFAGEGDNTIYGNGGNDRIVSSGGNDRIFGEDGNDVIDAGNGNNTIFGNGGNDQILSGSGTDVIHASSGNDVITVQGGDNLIYGNGGRDRITTGAGNDRIYGDKGDDIINAGDGDNRIFGNGGSDRITTGSGADTIFAASGNDIIITGAGDDLIYGNGGNDVFDAGTGNDQIFAEGGNDTFVLNAGEGQVEIFNYGVNDTLRLGASVNRQTVDVFTQGGNTIISSGDDVLATLRGVQAPDIAIA